MKKIVATLCLCFPLFATAQGVQRSNLQTNNYSLNISLSNEYDGPYKDEGVKGISEENRNGIYQQAGMFKSISASNQNKDAAGSAFLINSTTPLNSELLINETLGWLLKDDLQVTQCPNFRFQNFVPTCYVRNLRNEVRDVSFVVYSAISPNGQDAIVLVGLVGQPVSDGFDYRTIKKSAFSSANAIYYDLLKSVNLVPLVH